MLSVLSLLDYGDQPAASEGHHKSLTKLRILKKCQTLTEETVGDLKDSYLLKHHIKPNVVQAFWRVSDHLQLFRTLYKYYF